MVESGWMVITGAGGGIMEAGHRGAGRDDSFGLNILLPFEQSANPVVHGDPKLVTMQYFFTRKLMFIKESDAVVLFPGGFGTHDEAFEALTLVQTGKSHIFPIVMVDEPGGRYWKLWRRFIEDEPARARIHLAARHEPVPRDRFGRGGRARSHRLLPGLSQHALRSRRPGPSTADAACATGSWSRSTGGSRTSWRAGHSSRSEALPEEANEPELAQLPRLTFRFDRHAVGRLRQLIDVINAEG